MDFFKCSGPLCIPPLLYIFNPNQCQKMELWSRFLALVRVSYILNLLKSDGKSRCNVFLLVLLAKKNYNMIFHHFSRGIGNNHFFVVVLSAPKTFSVKCIAVLRLHFRLPMSDEQKKNGRSKQPFLCALHFSLMYLRKYK